MDTPSQFARLQYYEYRRFYKNLEVHKEVTAFLIYSLLDNYWSLLQQAPKTGIRLICPPNEEGKWLILFIYKDAASGKLVLCVPHTLVEALPDESRTQLHALLEPNTDAKMDFCILEKHAKDTLEYTILVKKIIRYFLTDKDICTLEVYSEKVEWWRMVLGILVVAIPAALGAVVEFKQIEPFFGFTTAVLGAEPGNIRIFFNALQILVLMLPFIVLIRWIIIRVFKPQTEHLL